MNISNEMLGAILTFVPSNSISKVLKSSANLPGILLRYYPFTMRMKDVRKMGRDVIMNLHHNTSVSKELIFYGAVYNGYCQLVHELMNITKGAPNPNFDDGVTIRDAYQRYIDLNKYKSYSSPKRKYSLVNMLLDYGSIDPSLRSNALLDMVIDEGHVDLVDRLLSDPRVLKVLYHTNQHPKHPFIIAAANGRTEIVRMFLKDKNINPSMQDNKAIKDASTKGVYSTVKLLLSDGTVNPGAQNSISILLAAKHGHESIFRALLVDPRVNPGAQDNSPIKIAAEHGYYNIVRMLLITSKVDPRIDLAINSNHPLRVACQNGHLEIVKLLLTEARVNPGDANSGAIVLAARKGHFSIVKLLLNDHRVDPTAKNNSLIREAAAHGRVKVLKILLQDPRIDPAVNNNEPIRLAAKHWKSEAVDLLIKDPRVDPQIGLYNIIKVYAFCWGDTNKRVINHPRVNFGKDNNKALYLAVKYGNTRVLRVLLYSEKGKKTVDPTVHGNRPEILFTAIDTESPNPNYKNHCQKPIIEMLIQHPDIQKGLSDGTISNPYVYAVNKNNIPIAEMLWKEYPIVRDNIILQVDNMIQYSK